MTFLNPLVLLGLAAAGIPLLLHLLNLRKLKTIEFSTLRFVKELQKTQIRKLKLQQILLLILRTLIVVFAVLAFSRPVLKSALPVFGSHVKSSVVILLDNSLSMDCSDEAGNRMKQARNAVQQICSALKDGDEVALLSSSDVGGDQKISFTRNTALMSERIQKIATAPRATEMSALLRMASSLMSDAQNLNKEVYLISDMQRNMFDAQVDSLKLGFGGATMFLVPVGAGAKLAGQNLAIDSVAVLSSIFQRDKSVDVEVFVRNTSGSDATGVVVGLSFNKNRVAQRSIDVPAGQRRSMILSAVAQQSGAVRAYAELEGDALENDNKRYFSFVIPPPPKVLLVGDADSRSYVQSVLQLEAGHDVFSLTAATPGESSALNFESYDVVLLCSALLKNDVDRMQSYVQKGGAAFVFAFEDRARLNELTQALGFAQVSELRLAKGQHVEFTTTDKAHPLFQGVFKNAENQRATVESALIEEAAPVTVGQEIIGMQAGSFLAESRVGDGRVLYCAVPPTTAWSNFPMTGIFPTIIFRSIPYLSAREQVGATTECGKQFSFLLPKRLSRMQRYKISDPLEVESDREAALLPSGAMLNLGQQNVVGSTVVRNMEGQDLCCFSTNVPASESQLSYYSPTEAQQEVLRHVEASTPIERIDIHTNIADGVARARMGTELWKLFVVLAILCALAEMFVARHSAKLSAQTA